MVKRGPLAGGLVLHNPSAFEYVDERAELLGLGVMVTVLERLQPGERRRALAYLSDRFAEREPAPEPVRAEQLPWSTFERWRADSRAVRAVFDEINRMGNAREITAMQADRLRNLFVHHRDSEKDEGADDGKP